MVDALLAAAERDGVCGSTFHIVDSLRTLTQNDYIETSRRALGSTLRVWRVPAPILKVAALAAEAVSRVTGRALPLSVYRLESSRPLGPFDCRAARERLGWTPRVGARPRAAYAPVSDGALSPTVTC